MIQKIKTCVEVVCICMQVALILLVCAWEYMHDLAREWMMKLHFKDDNI